MTFLKFFSSSKVEFEDLQLEISRRLDKTVDISELTEKLLLETNPSADKTVFNTIVLLKQLMMTFMQWLYSIAMLPPSLY